jgi:lipopolysaccharide transport system permease protein
MWLIFPPLANTLVWVFLDSQKVIEVDSGTVPYPLFVLSGAILWTAFNASVMAMLGVVNSARGLLAKMNFPHESLVYSALLAGVVDALIASTLLIPAIFIFGSGWRAEMPLFVLALMGTIIVGATIGLLMLPIAVLYGDVSRAIQLALRFGFFVTPVIFQLPAEGIARKLMLLNPVTPLIVSGRSWLTGSGEAMPMAFFAVVGASLVLFCFGMLVYKVAVPHLIERLGA